MRSLAIESYSTVAALSEATVIAVAVKKVNSSFQLERSEFDSLDVNELKLAQLGFKGRFGEIKLTTWRNYLVAAVGVGDKPMTNEKYREIGGSLARAVGSNEALAIGFQVDEVDNQIALLEGCALANVGKYSLKSSPEEDTFSKLFLPSSFSVSELDIENLGLAVQAVSSARQLVNMPSNLLYPETFAEKIKDLVDSKEVDVEIWDFRKLNRERCEGILAVGAGSFREPRLVKITYRPEVQNKHLALVGKGITFDTGGISLKSREGMAGMKYDMAGAASIFAATLAIAKLHLPIRVTAWLCIAENMPSGSAAKPNDVITYRNGKTVEIMNTDAEGRLVLADGLILASEEKPDLVIDVATLTGAATVALGKRYGAVMGNEAGTKQIMAAFQNSGESAWLMPMPEELRELLDSPIADIANAKLGNAAGGMILGAHFLSEFVGLGDDGNQLPWAHLDIAGPANNDGSPHGYTPKGATGYSVRTLIGLGQALAETNEIQE
jgi:leucyl aminopeptidase